MKNTKLIIFDLDGTLINAYPAIIRSFNYTMQKLGYPRQDSLTIRRAVGRGDENLLRPFIESRDLERATFIYRKHHKLSLIKDSRLFPKAQKVLKRLKEKGFNLAIASNRPTKFSWILIHHLKLDKYFDAVLCADKLRHIKPHPEILHKIMQKLSVKPKETFYVGDMAIDAQAGRRAKIKTIMVTTGSNTRQEIRREKPYRIIKSLSSLLFLIK